jgi:hypothetical protein
MATSKKQEKDIHVSNNNRNVNQNTVNVNVNTSSSEKGNTFKESFAEGMGNEMGKRTGFIIISIVIGILLILWFSMNGGLGDSSDSSAGQEGIIKEIGKNGNVQ